MLKIPQLVRGGAGAFRDLLDQYAHSSDGEIEALERKESVSQTSKQQTQSVARGTQKGFLSRFLLSGLPRPTQFRSPFNWSSGLEARPLVPALLLLTPLAGTGRLIVGWGGVESEAGLWPSPSVHLAFWSVPKGSAGVGDKAGERKGESELLSPVAAAAAPPAPPTAGLAPHCRCQDGDPHTRPLGWGLACS